MDENIDDFIPGLAFLTFMIRFFLKFATNLCIMSQSRINTGGSPIGADTSTILPKLCGPAISSPLLIKERSEMQWSRKVRESAEIK
jgi:hypothetical protein